MIYLWTKLCDIVLPPFMIKSMRVRIIFWSSWFNLESLKNMYYLCNHLFPHCKFSLSAQLIITFCYTVKKNVLWKTYVYAVYVRLNDLLIIENALFVFQLWDAAATSDVCRL